MRYQDEESELQRLIEQSKYAPMSVPEEIDYSKLQSRPEDIQPRLDETKITEPIARQAIEDRQIQSLQPKSPDLKQYLASKYDLGPMPGSGQEYESALEKQRQSDLLSGLGSAMDDVTKGLTGFESSNKDFYSQMAASGAAKPKNVLERQKMIQDYMAKKYGLDIQGREADARLAQLKADQEYKKEDLALKRQELGIKSASANEPKQLPAAQIAQLKEGETIPSTLQNLSGLIKEKSDLFGPVTGRILENNPYSKEGQLTRAQLKTASQQVGRFLEGGVLRKEDEAKYEQMLPKLSDTPEVAEGKLKLVYDMVSKKQEDLMKGVAGQKYSTAGFTEKFPEMKTEAPPPGATMRRKRPDGTWEYK